MSKITTFAGKPGREEFKNELAKEFSRIENKLGIKLSFGGGSYTGESFTLKVEARILNADGEAVTELEKSCLQSAQVPYGSRLVIKGRFFTVSGFNMNKPKNSIKITGTDGKTYGCSTQTAKICMVK